MAEARPWTRSHMEKLKSTESREKNLPWEWSQAQPSHLLWQHLRSRNRQGGGGEDLYSFYLSFLPLSPSLQPSLPFFFLSSLPPSLPFFLDKGQYFWKDWMIWNSKWPKSHDQDSWQARKDSIFVGTGYCGKFKHKEKSGSKARPSGSLFWLSKLPAWLRK